MKALSKKSKAPFVTYVYQRLLDGVALVCLALAAFVLVALLSYHEGDPGWSRTALHHHIINSAGPVGAYLADVLFSLFGYLAYLGPLMLIWLSQNYLKKASQASLTLLMLSSLGFVLALAAGTGLAALHFFDALYILPEGAGGILGKVLVHVFTPRFHYLGSTLILLALFFTGLTLAMHFSWLELIDKLGSCVVRYSLSSFRLAHRMGLNLQRWVTSQNLSRPVIKPMRLEPPVKVVAPKSPTSVEPVLKRCDPKSSKPSLDLLQKAKPHKIPEWSAIQLQGLAAQVENRLGEFGVGVKVVNVLPGPVVTRFEMELQAGQKVSKITALAKDLARALSVTRVRIVEVIPGKPFVGLEIPNQSREIVCLRDIIDSSEYNSSEVSLPLALGKDISGRAFITGLSQMPHLLVAGTTGSGKSVGINTMLISLLYKASIEDLRLILIDPKMLELSVYEGIPHLLTPVVTDMKEAGQALKWCVAEMERRYQLLSSAGLRNLDSYNQKIREAKRCGKPLIDKDSQTPLDILPYIVVIIDEFADMIMVVGKKVEELIARLAQKARAAGIHLILATQRPSVDVITGLIKANIPTRIAFQVSSRIDSRTILDQQGAEQLLGQGDMLYLAPGTGIPTRIHGAFISDEEVHRVVKALKVDAAPEFMIDLQSLSRQDSAAEGDEDLDSLFDLAVQIVIDTRRASISHLQRRLKIGYNRAARLIESLEQAQIVSPVQLNGNREVLAPPSS